MDNHGNQPALGEAKAPPVWRSRLTAYGFAVAVSGLTLVARFSLEPWLGRHPVLILFILPIIFSAYVGGLGPGLLATAISAGGIYYYLLAPEHILFFEGSVDLWQLVILMMAGALISFLTGALHRSQKRTEITSQLQAVTLASIGDAVITTDAEGQVTFLNGEAERLTGWTNAAAGGRPLPEVFHIVKQATRETMEDPVKKVFRTGMVVGLANDTVLIARDGREFVIDDSGAPIRQADGTIVGVVLVFRDNTAKKRAADALRESQALFRSLVDQMPAGIFRKNAEGRYVFVNASFCAMKARPPEAFLGKTALELEEKSLAASRASHHAQIMQTGRTIEVEEEFVTADGPIQHFHVVKSPVFDAEGNIIGTQGFLFDVTERKQLEEELRAAGERTKFYMNRMPLGFIAWDRDFRAAEWNAAAGMIFGWPASEAIGRHAHELIVPPEVQPPENESWKQIISAGDADSHSINEHVTRDGRRIICEWRNTPWRDADGQVCGFLSIVSDITETKLAAEKFAREQARFKLIFDTVPVGIAFRTLHPDGPSLRTINDAHLRICGLTREQHDLPGIYTQITHPDDRAIQQRFDQQVQAGLIKRFSLEKRYLHSDGKIVWVDFSYQRENYPDGTIEELTTVVDITERKAVEQQLMQLAVIVESSEDAIISKTLAGVITSWNRGAQMIFGYPASETIGQPMLMLFPAELKHEEADILARIARGESVERLETERIRKDGTHIRISATISPLKDGQGKIVGASTIARDTTRQRALEEQLRQSQKMEAIGQLAGGVAHDFNNIMAVIQMQTELSKMAGSLSREQSACIDEIQIAANRAANLTRQLLLFSRRQRLQPRELDLSDSITGMTKMLRRILGEHIQMQFKYTPQPLFIHADAGMMDQVLMNLTLNSRDAMPNGGQLVIETAAVEFDALAASQTAQARPGSFVRLSVSDTGCGISPKILPHIFEPFFTTKDVGKGTGLGLATVFSIVQQHQGWVSVYSEPGRGTTFHIYLPRLSKISARQSVVESTLTTASGGNETILLVEDDDALRASVRKSLVQLGYQLLEAANGTEALQVWRQHHDKINLLLTDLVMPGSMSGKELGERLRQQNPKLKVIYASGYSAEMFGKDFPLAEGVNFLAKPFPVQTLAQTVRACLDAI